LPALPARLTGLLTHRTALPIGAALLVVTAVAGVAPVAIALVGLAVCGCAWLLAAAPGPADVRLLGVALGFCGLSTVLAAVSAGLLPGAMAGDVPLPAEIPLVGLFFVAGPSLVGLFLMPGLNATFVGRLRRALDGFGIGIWLFFIAWLLVFETAGLKGAGLTAVLLATVAVSAAAVGALRAMRFRRTALPRGVGVIAMLVGQTGLVLALDYHASGVWLALSGVPLLGGPLLTVRAVRASEPLSRPVDRPGDDDGSFAGYPMLALPLAAALVTAAYRLIEHIGFDQVGLLLAIAGVFALAVREALAMTDVRRYASRLATREEHFRALVVGSTDVTVVLDGDLVVRWQSPSAARQFGLADQDVVGRPLTTRVHPDDMALVAGALDGVRDGNLALIEARLRDGFGIWRDTEWSVDDQRAVPAVGGFVVHVRDVGERKHLREALHRVAFVDQLTGLSNRHDLRRVLDASTDSPGVLIMLGLVGMGGVNQVRGLEVGDAVMVEAARRLRTDVPAAAVVARLDGDRFAVLTEAGAVQAQLLATRLLTVLGEPYSVLGVESFLSANAGLAEGPSETALQQASLALQRARRIGAGSPPLWYDEATEALLHRRLTMEQELPGAASRCEFDLVYEPVVRLADLRPVGITAHLRWQHPTLGTVPFDDLLPVAADVGLVEETGDWLLSRACRQLGQWLRDERDLWISITVAPTRLAAPGFVATVTAVAEAHEVPLSRLIFSFSFDPDLFSLDSDLDQGVVANLAELRSLGARTALDHFGAQPTSLRRLRLLPLDLLNLDQDLLGEDSGQPGAIVALAHQLGVEVAMRGLTTEHDLTEATTAGCQLGQGAFIGLPAPPERVEAFLDTNRSTRY
jgi:PAS domain S-box-containing protein/diguanylate cyclase (GGDEF)-like protein